VDIIRDYLVKNKYSRPGTPLKTVSKIVVHYVGNPGSTAKNNRDYFNNMPEVAKKRPQDVRYVSSHYIIGLSGEIIACVPENEIAYCSNSANSYSISIENCHPDSSGRFNPATLRSLIELLADLCKRYGLNPKTDIIRHYDVTGKACPLWYVSHADEWDVLRDQVADKLSGKVVEPLPEKGTLYRVQVGAFAQRENAEAMQKKLQGAGYPSFVVQVEK